MQTAVSGDLRHHWRVHPPSPGLEHLPPNKLLLQMDKCLCAPQPLLALNHSELMTGTKLDRKVVFPNKVCEAAIRDYIVYLYYDENL